MATKDIGSTVSRHYQRSEDGFRTVRMVFTVIEVMQGCVLSPVLFNTLLEVVIALALEGNDVGATTSGNLISNLRFADDICLVTTSNDDVQQLVDAVHTTSIRFGLTVSSSKTVIQNIGKDVQQMKIMLGNCQLEQCPDFVYLGGNISQDASCDKDVVRRIGLAAGIVRSLHQI